MEQVGIPVIAAFDKETGEVVDPAILQEQGIAFDPTQMTLQLKKEEMRRTTALMLAIQAYDKLIIKDAEYLKEMHNEARRENGPVIRPATMEAMVRAAIQFDAFISGDLERAQKAIIKAISDESDGPKDDGTAE